MYLKRTKEERERFTGSIIDWIGQATAAQLEKGMPRLKAKLQASRQKCFPPKTGWKRGTTYKYFAEVLLTKAQVQAIRDALKHRWEELAS